MKKIILFAVFAVLGGTVISCSYDDNGIENPSGKTNGFTPETDYNAAFLREVDTIPVNDTLTTNQVVDPGPGDDPIIVPPPPTKP